MNAYISFFDVKPACGSSGAKCYSQSKTKKIKITFVQSAINNTTNKFSKIWHLIIKYVLHLSQTTVLIHVSKKLSDVTAKRTNWNYPINKQN